MDNTGFRKFVQAGCILLTGILFTTGASASFIIPFDSLTQSYTYVTVESHHFGTGRINAGDANLEASTLFSETINITNAVGAFAGQVDGTGNAKFGTLGAKVNVLDGSGAQDGFASAGFNEIFTVAPPAGVAPGTQGSMSFFYLLDGETIIDYNATTLGDDRINGTVSPWAPDFLAVMRFNIVQRTATKTTRVLSDTRALMSLDDLPTGTASTGGPANAVLSHALISGNVTFNYGEPFALSTELRVDGFVDQGSGAADTPYINEVTVDFLNTARLVAIVNEDHPDAIVTGLGGNYSQLVTDTAPQVPLPAAAWLFTSALLLIGRFGFRKRTE